jgi:FkbM family methyltransferase
MYRGQNLEDKIVSDWFGQYIGVALEIGANDGVTYSNSFHLIENWWGAVLVEPSQKVFPKLAKLHENNNRVICVNCAIGDHNGIGKLLDSGDFLLKGTCSLLSTLKPEETKRWGDVSFEETEVNIITFNTLLKQSPYKKFQFVSLDAEGMDLDILRQIDLNRIDCRCICVEHNSSPNILVQIKEYCAAFGLNKILGTNAENIIICR